MKRILIIAALCFSAQTGWADQSSPEHVISAKSPVERLLDLGQADEVSQACCKLCQKGKACGNSCISRNYTCHKGKGCACNS